MMLTRSTLLVLASLLLLTASLRAEEKEAPKRPDKDVIEAWKKAGFSFGWYGKNRHGTYIVTHSYDSESFFGSRRPELPAFELAGPPARQLDKLPQPAMPFALSLDNGMFRAGLAIGKMVAEEAVGKKLPSRTPPPKTITDAALEELPEWEKLVALDLRDTPVTGRGLKALARQKNLAWLNLRGTTVKDEGLKELAGIRNLTRLVLADTRVTDEGAKHLKGLVGLTELDLGQTGVRDEGLKELAALENLTELNLFGTQVTGEGLKAFPNLAELDLREAPTSDAGLKELRHLTRLTRLGLSLTEVTDAKVDELAGLTCRFDLSLREVRVTGDDLRKLARLEKIERLTYEETDTTDDVLQALRKTGLLRVCPHCTLSGMREPAKSTQEVTICLLTSTKVTDKGLQALRGLTKLEVLGLSNTQITDAGLKELHGLTNLTRLYLRGTQVTDAGLRELAGLEKLADLDLATTQVTDAGLEELEGLKNLIWLDLTGTQVTDAGVSRLQKALPECTIIRKSEGGGGSTAFSLKQTLFAILWTACATLAFAILVGVLLSRFPVDDLWARGRPILAAIHEKAAASCLFLLGVSILVILACVILLLKAT